MYRIDVLKGFGCITENLFTGLRNLKGGRKAQDQFMDLEMKFKKALLSERKMGQ